MMFSNDTSVVQSLPSIILRGLIPLPNNEMRVDVAKQESIEAIKRASKENKYIALLIQRNLTVDNPKKEDIYDFGVVGKIIYDMEVQGLHKVKLANIVRFKLIDIVQTEPYFVSSFATIPASSSDQTKEIAYVRLLLDELKKGVSRMLESNKDVLQTISKGITADKLADILAFQMKTDINSKLKYVKTSDTVERLQFVLEDLKKENYILSLEEKIEEDVKRSISESQKEYYLREKMKAIQNELGDKVKKESDVELLREKIIKCKMPKQIEEKALDELARYNTLSNGGGEASISRTYLDFIVSLPWSVEAKETSDLKKAKEQLDKDHYGLESVKERILEYLAVRVLTKKNPQAILCLVGPPGVGKTSLAKSIASSLNKPFVKQSLGGVKDESEIRGHRRTYLGALPGRILQGMKKAKVTNPVFLLDELDKLSSDYRGDPSSALLEVLDSEQNKFFSDHYLEEPYDLSNVFFIATANYLENIPAPLRDRLEIVELSSYTEFEKFEIGKKHLIGKQLFLHGLSKCDFELTDEALWRIIREYTKEAGVRELERNIGTLVRKAIKIILIEGCQNVLINDENLEKWLGKPKYSYTKLEKNDQIGVVTGLAYTQYGGDTLPVEVTYYKGNGKLVLTGKLGDVMKESAQAALSNVRSNAKKYDIQEDLFETCDIHIHVPEGAVPKDGPSAGVTIATGIISALSHKKVNHYIGMTGEITLRGRVLPIGGLREKSIAAHRSGLKKILIPKDNEKDIELIPDSVKKELEIVCVETLDDVVKEIFVD